MSFVTITRRQCYQLNVFFFFLLLLLLPYTTPISRLCKWDFCKSFANFLRIQSTAALSISNTVSDRLHRSSGTATLGRTPGGSAQGEVPTCSPGKNLYKCSTLGRKVSTSAAGQQQHFHSHLHGHQHLPSDFMASGGGGGGSVMGISSLRAAGSGQFSSTNELPLIIPMPLMMEQPPSNVPILNSILTSSGHNNNNNNNSNNHSNFSGGSGSTATLKKRVQIQEVTV